MWLVTWKLHFVEWKTHSFVLKFSPQNAENRIFRTLKFQNFLGQNVLRSPLPPLEKGTNSPLLIQSVTLSKPLATSIFIETPGSYHSIDITSRKIKVIPLWNNLTYSTMLVFNETWDTVITIQEDDKRIIKRV